MKVQMKRGRQAQSVDIDRLEQEIGGALPTAFLDFVREHDGAKPDINIFKVGNGNECGVNGFIPVREILVARAHMGDLPSTTFPIAWAEGGNYVYIDVATAGAVYFWDHEQPTRLELAPDFSAFIDQLEPFDPRSVQLKAGQVKSSWIDPDFLESLQRLRQ